MSTFNLKPRDQLETTLLQGYTTII